ncbi:MAG: hypothetical protein FJ109_00605 [Deltaproteobacteria bacterium]|nr:hypothetical protein [Deltaproteobacteria bacterium]
MVSNNGVLSGIGRASNTALRLLAEGALVLVLASLALSAWGCGNGSDRKVVDPAYDVSGDGGPLAQCYHIGEKWPQSYPPMTEENAYQLALKWSQCGAMVGTKLAWFWQCAMGTCLPYEVPDVDPPSMECILAAKDCDEVRCCWGVNSDASCNPDTFEGGCDGSVHVSCWPLADGRHMVRMWDCAWSSGNPQCLLDTDGHRTCGSGTCPDGGVPATCEGNVRVSCEKGVERRVDCAERGRICAVVATGDGQEAACVLKKGCLVPYCDGTVFVMCKGGAEVARYNCDWYGEGFTCTNPTKDGSGDWTGGCLPPPDKACDPDKDEDYCEGAVAHYCTGHGAWAEFDCAGFVDGACRKYCPLDFGGGECDPGDDTCTPVPPCDPTDPTQGNSVGCAEGK